MSDGVKRRRFWPYIALATLFAAATAVFLVDAWQASRDEYTLPNGDTIFVLHGADATSAASYLVAAAISGLRRRDIHDCSEEAVGAGT